VCSDSEFKYPIYRTIGQHVRFDSERPTSVVQRNYGFCKCYSCTFCFNYYNGSVYAFFSERKREHYYQLYENVFIWLDGLHLEYLTNDNPRYILENVYAEIGKNSMFNEDARRHMSRRMRDNIDIFEKNLKGCNDYIDSTNPIINNVIHGIISQPIQAKLTEEQISSVYRIVHIGFSQAIKGTEDIETAVKNWDLATKAKAQGFNTRTEIDNVKNILAAIQQDNTIIDKIKELKSKISSLENQQNIIKNQSKEISSQITANRYRARHRCCPSIFKELWHTF